MLCTEGGKKQVVVPAVVKWGQDGQDCLAKIYSQMTVLYLYFYLYTTKTNITAKYLTNRTICC